MHDAEWNIRPPAPQCAACGRLFAAGETLVSRLVSDPEPGLTRRDLCVGCAAGLDDGAISSWRTVWRPPPAPEEPLKRETAESLLRRLLEERNPAMQPAIFVLAVMLERKRVLVERDVQLLEQGHRRRIYEHRGTGEVFAILDPRLRLDELSRVQEDVARLLAGT